MEGQNLLVNLKISRFDSKTSRFFIPGAEGLGHFASVVPRVRSRSCSVWLVIATVGTPLARLRPSAAPNFLPRPTSQNSNFAKDQGHVLPSQGPV